ncbi:unnamed protein product [Cylindrotheca closterium]|uniref:Uncharacterized protein n=1 Tax=Cylindrotheca closterium TaxID=2856 RepID=A0AAD2FGR6_9STRA|nr:unnamed protein product [Cylindrotheca closterium]
MQPLDYSEQEIGYNVLSDVQENILAILPIPSALLSICGGLLVVITALRSRKDRPWTPYQGLQTSLSICNIISSFTVASGAFMRPSETSNQVWAFGNDTSCTVNGFFGQLGTSALVYNGMLSYFFLLRLRFDHNVTAITLKFEPLMHIVAVGYPLVTAFLGLFFDAYGERVGSPGCAIQTCHTDYTGQREDCMLDTVDLVFRRSIDFFVIGSMVMNTIIITTHLSTVIEKHTRLSSVNAELTKTARMDEENVSQEIILERKAKVDKNMNRAKFKKGELLQVKLQGAFFIGSYVICNFATIILQMIVAQKSKLSYKEEMEVPYHYFSLMVLQAVLFPLLGFLNCVAYMKPAFARTRSQHKQESTLWVLRRTVCGDSVTPTCTAEVLRSNARRSKCNKRKSKAEANINGQPMKVTFQMEDVHEEDDEVDIMDSDSEATDKSEGAGTDQTSASDQDAGEVEETSR